MLLDACFTLIQIKSKHLDEVFHVKYLVLYKKLDRSILFYY